MDLKQLCALAQAGLIPMFDADKQLFCYRLKRSDDRLVREGLSQRYTTMSVLGLWRLEQTMPASSPISLHEIAGRLLGDTAWANNIGDLGLLLWLCSALYPERLQDCYSKLNFTTALNTFSAERDGRTMELSWFLSGLAHAAQKGGRELRELDKISARTFRLLLANQGRHGFFGHLSTTGTARGAIRGRIGSFADQVYPIYAFATFGGTFENRAALEAAQRCAEAICSAQGDLGQWWWHYDSLTGKVFQRYPVYAVHQHGMAPMALLALSDATGLDFTEAIFKGLRWIDGPNELGRSLRETSANLVWRNIYRPKALKRYASEVTNFLRGTYEEVAADDLNITFECRPYELGWLLYAFAGREL